VPTGDHQPDREDPVRVGEDAHPQSELQLRRAALYDLERGLGAHERREHRAGARVGEVGGEALEGVALQNGAGIEG